MDNLFELPDPDLRMPGLRIGAPPRDYFTADQLRACVLAAIQAEREACAKFFDLNDTNLFWGSQAAQHIRARN